ncbi:MAG: DUF2066 domain-containing protein [Alphaproteobacteria bacterium]|nr:DUF2066 domain-containing protein [Alphaproteobacteria bacterium]
MPLDFDKRAAYALKIGPCMFFMVYGMSLSRFSTRLRMIAVICLISGAFSCVMPRLAAAAGSAPSKAVQGNILPDNPLAVGGIVIDKTAANSVVAREQAIASAKREAFRKLAEAAMSPAGFAALHMPSDNDLSLLVQDFEIENEQMSTTRYIGTFTVRFSPEVKNYIGGGQMQEAQQGQDAQQAQQQPFLTPPSAATSAATSVRQPPQQAYSGPQAAGLSTGTRPELNLDHAQPAAAPDENGIIWNDTPRQAPAQQAAAPVMNPAPVPASRDNPAAPVPQASAILVLPYYENIAGQTLLWEEPNPWLHIWQSDAPSRIAGGPQFIVPLGDIDDIAAGPANAVWKGDYRTLETLRRHYHADAVALAVANRSGPNFTVDMYYYMNGGLRRRITLTPFVPGGATDEQVFKRGVGEVMRSLQPAKGASRSAPVMSPVERISRDVTASMPVPSAEEAQAQRPVPEPMSSPAPVLKPQMPMQMNPLQTSSRPPMALRPSPDPATPAPLQAAPVPGTAMVEAQMKFPSFGAWMDVQRRVAALSPPVKLSLRSLSSNSARFTLGYGGSLEALTDALATAGLVLADPARLPTGETVYDLTLAH